MDATTFALAALRGVHVAALLSLFGSLVFGALVAPAAVAAAPAVGPAVRTRLRRIAVVSALLALMLGVAWLVLQAAVIAGADSVGDTVSAVPVVAADTRFGRLVLVRLGVLLAVVPLLWTRRLGLVAAILLAGGALGLQPALGHAGASGSAGLVASEALHLLAAGAWLGGLLPLLVCLPILPPRAAAAMCERFTPLGLTAVFIIAATGMAQGGELIGSVPALIGTAYGRAALLKLVLFMLLLGLAALNRLALTDRLTGTDPVAARRHLLLSVAFETTIGAAVVLAAGLLASLPPGVHEQPTWPFAWRPSLAALDDPDIRREVALALAVLGGGVAVAAGGLFFRRWRLPVLVLGGALVLLAAPHLDPVLVEAYSTSYFVSPTSFSAESIVHGQALFGVHCAACHGPGGQGDGPGARSLPAGAADLTAAHLWDHSDGELYWWLTDGMRTPEGALMMPGFPTLSSGDRWALIDFVRANNAGAAMRATGSWPQPIRTPALPIACDSGQAREMADLRGSVVRVVAAADPAVAPKPAIPSQNGVKVVTLTLGASGAQPVTGGCVAMSEAGWTSYAILSGVSAETLAGSQFLVDPNGWLRARWREGDPDGWSDRDRLISEVRRICATPVSTAAGGGHAGMH
jgi:putative copper export protein/mono/diheme cytochrome c family protein